MGSTLEHGIYLPSEGEKNCYSGLANNWQTVDTNIGYITSLRQAIAGALTRQIVTQLPTENIDPNCIYMILKATAQTSNIYDEYMYINSNWELIGDSQLDLSNYYTKQEVNELPAVASGVTSTKVGNYDTHIADTNIHVTANDKTKWTNSANTHVLRLALSALTPSTSDNSFSNLDDSTALKVGDKVMDTAGVLFEVTAIDTANSTFTIGTSLIDLAQDSDVVHKSGNETIAGEKTFTDDIIKGYTTITSRMIKGVGYSKTTGLNGNSFIQLQANLIYNDSTPNKQTTVTLESLENAYTDGKSSAFYSNSNNLTNLGKSGKRWANVYATNYYYGGSEIEFSDKFVTTDTNQTINGQKTFTNNLNFQSNSAEYGVTSGNIQFYLMDKNSNGLSKIDQGVFNNGISYITLQLFGKDSNNQTVTNRLQYQYSSNFDYSYVLPTDNSVWLGSTGNRWGRIYGIQYYYGNDNVEFSSKFVTTDTAQTIGQNKTFTGIININHTKGGVLQLTCPDLDNTTDVTGNWATFISFNSVDNGQTVASKGAIGLRQFKNGKNFALLLMEGSETLYFGSKSKSDSTKALYPENSGVCSLGTSTNKWSTINGLEPSALGMPDLGNGVDISGYITHLDKVVNTYTPTVNGFIHIRVKKISLPIASIRMQQTNGLISSCETSEFSIWGTYLPVVANKSVDIYIYADSLVSAIFFPCQGNV